MINTTAELVKEFNPTFGYTQSDEITLVFMPQKDQFGQWKNLAFNGRVQKIVSLLSGFCSVRFAYHLSIQTFDSLTEKDLLDKIHLAYFDGRIFSIPDASEVLNNVIWRMTDAKRNSKNNLGHIHFAQKEVEGLHPGQILEKLLEKGVDWNEMPPAYKWGSFVKKGQYQKISENPKTGEKITAIRSRVAVGSFDLRFSEDNLKLITEKFTNDTTHHDVFQPLENA